MKLLARCTKTWWPLAMVTWLIGSLAGAHDAAAHAVHRGARSVAIRFSERVEPATGAIALVAGGLTGALFLKSRRDLTASRRPLSDTPEPPVSEQARR